MKTILLFLCMLVVLPYEGNAQWQNHVDTTYSSLIISNNYPAFQPVVKVRGGNTVALIQPPPVNLNYPDGLIMLNGTTYNAMRLNGDQGSYCGANFIKFAENSDSTIVLGGTAPSPLLTKTTARARVTNIGNLNFTELAISFERDVDTVSLLAIKGAYLNDSLLFLLIEGITTATTVKVVLNNGQPQTGTSLTGNGSAFLKIDRQTGTILGQTYFNHNPNDGWLNYTFFNKNALIRIGNRFFFSSINSLGGNFMLHTYDNNLNLINDIPITTSAQSRANDHLYERAIGYGIYNGDEYLGLIPDDIPVVVNLTTSNVNYITAGKVFGNSNSSSVLFLDSAFVFMEDMITRVELSDMVPSVMRKDWITNSSTLNGIGMSATQRNARLGSPKFFDSEVVNNQIEYYAYQKISNTMISSGIYINGEQITSDTLFDDDYVVFKGTLGLSPESYTGTETQFDSDTCVDSVEVDGWRVTYPVDSVRVDNVAVRRTPGQHAVLMGGVQANETIDFSNGARNIISTLDYPSPGDISTIRTYVERVRIVEPDDTTTIDTSDVSLREELEVAPIYPNPFRDYITIPELYDNRNFRMNIYDMSGRVILQEQNIAGRIQLSHLIPGVYIVHIFDNHGYVSRQRIVKQH